LTGIAFDSFNEEVTHDPSVKEPKITVITISSFKRLNSKVNVQQTSMVSQIVLLSTSFLEKAV
jgi:hypothetical protein